MPDVLSDALDQALATSAPPQADPLDAALDQALRSTPTPPTPAAPGRAPMPTTPRPQPSLPTQATPARTMPPPARDADPLSMALDQALMAPAAPAAPPPVQPQPVAQPAQPAPAAPAMPTGQPTTESPWQRQAPGANPLLSQFFQPATTPTSPTQTPSSQIDTAELAKLAGPLSQPALREQNEAIEATRRGFAPTLMDELQSDAARAGQPSSDQDFIKAQERKQVADQTTSKIPAERDLGPDISLSLPKAYNLISESPDDQPIMSHLTPPYRVNGKIVPNPSPVTMFVSKKTKSRMDFEERYTFNPLDAKARKSRANIGKHLDEQGKLAFEPLPFDEQTTQWEEMGANDQARNYQRNVARSKEVLDAIDDLHNVERSAKDAALVFVIGKGKMTPDNARAAYEAMPKDQRGEVAERVLAVEDFIRTDLGLPSFNSKPKDGEPEADIPVIDNNILAEAGNAYVRGIWGDVLPSLRETLASYAPFLSDKQRKRMRGGAYFQRLVAGEFPKSTEQTALRWATNVLGEQAPRLQMMLHGAGGTSGVASRLGLSGRAASNVGVVTATGLGFAGEAGQYINEVRDELMRAGVDPDEAQQQADREAAVYGTFAAVLEVAPIWNIIKGNPAKGRWLMRRLRQSVAEGSTEAAQRLTQEVISEFGHGDKRDVKLSQMLQGAFDEGLAGALVGAFVPGGAGVSNNAASSQNTAQPIPRLNPPQEPPNAQEAQAPAQAVPPTPDVAPPVIPQGPSRTDYPAMAEGEAAFNQVRTEYEASLPTEPTKALPPATVPSPEPAGTPPSKSERSKLKTELENRRIRFLRDATTAELRGLIQKDNDSNISDEERSDRDLSDVAQKVADDPTKATPLELRRAQVWLGERMRKANTADQVAAIKAEIDWYFRLEKERSADSDAPSQRPAPMMTTDKAGELLAGFMRANPDATPDQIQRVMRAATSGLPVPSDAAEVLAELDDAAVASPAPPPVLDETQERAGDQQWENLPQEAATGFEDNVIAPLRKQVEHLNDIQKRLGNRYAWETAVANGDKPGNEHAGSAGLKRWITAAGEHGVDADSIVASNSEYNDLVSQLEAHRSWGSESTTSAKSAPTPAVEADRKGAGKRPGAKFAPKDLANSPNKLEDSPDGQLAVDPAKATPEAPTDTEKDADQSPEETGRVAHRPRDDGPPAHDLLDTDLAPRDIYDHPEYYVGDINSREARESIMAIRKIRGNPDATVTVYRSAPKGAKLRAGDWVSLSRTYAQQSGLGEESSQDMPVMAVKVSARDVRWAGDDLNEFGYYPSSKPAALPTVAESATVQPLSSFTDLSKGDRVLFRGQPGTVTRSTSTGVAIKMDDGKMKQAKSLDVVERAGAEQTQAAKPADESDESRLHRFKAKKYKTAGDEKTIAILTRRMEADPSKWSVGDGIGYRVGGGKGQINRGFRVIAIDAKAKTATIRQVADTGLTSTGGDFDQIGDQVLAIGDLVRDRHYDFSDAPADFSPYSPNDTVTYNGKPAKVVKAGRYSMTVKLENGKTYKVTDEGKVKKAEPATIEPEAGSGTEPTQGSKPERQGSDADDVRPRPLVGVKGKSAKLVVADRSQHEVQYVAVEAEALIPSHDARKNFRRNADGYPNERPYHDQKEGRASRETVERIAANPNGDLLTTDTPTAIDGPPISMPDGRVVGGNARTMGIQLAYRRGGEAAGALRQAANAAARKFGLDVDQVAGMKEPIIVRVITGATNNTTLSSILNEALTTTKTTSVDAASRANRVSEETAGIVAAYLEPDSNGESPSIREVLADGRRSRRLMNLLMKDGAWTESDIARFTDSKTGELFEDGKLSIERTLLGKLIQDPGVVGSMSRGLKGKIMSSLAPLTRAINDDTHGARVRQVIEDAAETFDGYKSSGLTLGDYFFNQQTLMPIPGFGDKAVAAVVGAIDRLGPRQFRDAADQMVSGLGIHVGGQTSFGQESASETSTDDAITSAFSRDAAPDGLFAPDSTEQAENASGAPATDKAATKNEPAGEKRADETWEEWARRKLNEKDTAEESARNKAAKGKRQKGSAGSLDPERLFYYAVIGAAKIRRGISNFAAWAKSMTADHPDIEPHLPRIWSRSGELANLDDPGQATFIRNSFIERQRKQLGMPPAPAHQAETFQQWDDQARRRLDDDPRAGDKLVTELQFEPRSLNRVEVAVLNQHLRLVTSEYNRVNKELVDATVKGNTDRIADLEASSADLFAQLDELGVVKRNIAGYEAGTALAAFKLGLNEDMTLSTMIAERRAAVGGRELTDAENSEIKGLHEQIRTLQERLKERDNQLAEKDRQAASARAHGEITRESTRSKKPARTPDDITSGIDENTTAEELSNLARELSRHFIEQGVTNRDANIDAVHDVLSDIYPDMARRETMDAISRYGQSRPPTSDPITVRLQEISGEMQQLAKLADMEAGNPPLATGQRRTPMTDEHRRLTKLVNEAKKKGGFIVTDPARQLRSALDAIKTRLRNAIADLKSQIATREKLVKTPRELKYDEEATALKARRDELKKQFDEIFGKPKTSDAKRLELAIRATERSSAELERRIAEKDFSKPGRPPVTSPELDAMKARRAALAEQLAELKANDPASMRSDAERSLQAYKRNLAERKARFMARLAKRDFQTYGQKSRVLDPEAKKIQAELDAIKEQWHKALYEDRMRRRLTAEKAELDEQLTTGNFPEPVSREPRELPDDIAMIQHQVEVRRRRREMERREQAPKGLLSWAIEPFRIAKSLLLGIDFGQVLRQGKLALATHPILTAKNLVPMFKAFASEKAERRVMQDWENHPLAALGDKAGLDLTVAGGSLFKQDEIFRGILADKIPLIKNFNRSYRTFLNKTRFDLFISAIHALERRGGKVTVEQATVVANFINVSTGRGRISQRYAGAVVAAADLMLAPRYQVSRAQWLLLQPLWGAGPLKGTGKARAYVVKEYARQLAGLSVYYSALVLSGNFLFGDDDDDFPVIEFDPRSTDFLKVRIGETRLDPMAGIQQWAVYATRMVTGQIKTRTGVVLPIRGSSTPYGSTTTKDVTTNFARGRMDILPGMLWDRFFSGKTPDYQEATVMRLMANSFTPLAPREIYEELQYSEGMTKAAALTIMVMFGESANTYDAVTERQERRDRQRLKQSERKDRLNNSIDDATQQLLWDAARVGIASTKDVQALRENIIVGKPYAALLKKVTQQVANFRDLPPTEGFAAAYTDAKDSGDSFKADKLKSLLYGSPPSKYNKYSTGTDGLNDIKDDLKTATDPSSIEGLRKKYTDLADKISELINPR